jgi:hypothetical protein
VPYDSCVLCRRRRASDIIQYLRDGIFLDNSTLEVNIRTVLYNREVAMLGTSRVSLTWLPSGVIAVDAPVSLCPLVAQQYGHGGLGEAFRQLNRAGLIIVRKVPDFVAIRNVPMIFSLSVP